MLRGQRGDSRGPKAGQRDGVHDRQRLARVAVQEDERALNGRTSAPRRIARQVDVGLDRDEELGLPFRPPPPWRESCRPEEQSRWTPGLEFAPASWAQRVRAMASMQSRMSSRRTTSVALRTSVFAVIAGAAPIPWAPDRGLGWRRTGMRPPNDAKSVSKIGSAACTRAPESACAADRPSTRRWTPAASGRPNLPSFRSRSWTISARSRSAGSSSPRRALIVSNEHLSPSWVKSAPTMSNDCSPFRTVPPAASTNRNLAAGSTKRRMSHAVASRSMWGSRRVTQTRPLRSSSDVHAPSSAAVEVFNSVLDRRHERLHLRARFRSEKVRLRRGIDQPLQTKDVWTGWRCVLAPTPRRQVFGEGLLDRSEPAGRVVKESSSQFTVRGCPDERGPADDRLAAAGDRFLRDPLQVFEALGRVREDVDRVLQWHRADLSQPASDLRSKIERPRRQLMNQQEPTRAIGHLERI